MWKKYNIKGFVSLFTIGAGLRGLPDLSGTGGGLSLEDKWRDCPDPYAANGGAFNSGINFVVGVGGSLLSTWQIGRLRGENILDGPSYGLDVGLAIGMGSSAVTSVKEENCDEC
ncbi:hypothetical protein EII20_14170 [Comamonadaceae bacterium OH2545_COT-014]|nr:hypothetical protein EII20_14170 [Comamonadaceae bacterium OH2545_COT-014]